MRALVLSGGGAKGAYEIGVAKALKKLKIKYDIVTGTSVGSLNGLMLVSKDLRKAEKLWKNMNFNFVFDEEMVEKYNNVSTTKDMIEMFSKNFIKNGGMDVNNLEIAIKKYFNKNKFFRSNINYGLVTYNLSKNKSIFMRKSQLTKDNIIDYAMASSSCYPAIRKRKIGNDYYIDGGIVDNLPINLAIDLGATEIIAVDLKAPGIKAKVKDKNIPITYLSPRNEIVNFLDFSKDKSKVVMNLGYLDTMKYYSELDGNLYTFKLNDLKKNHDKYYDKIMYKLDEIFDFDEGKTTLDEIIRTFAFKRIASINKKNNDKIINEIVEYLGQTFDIDNSKCYRIKKFNKIVVRKLNNLTNIEGRKIDEFSKLKVLDIRNKQNIIKYFYISIKNCSHDNQLKKQISKFALTFPKDFLAALYLYVVKESNFLW